MKKYDVFKSENWFFRRYDGRRKEFKGITREEFSLARDRHFSHVAKKYIGTDIYAKRRGDIAYFATIPYDYAGDGYNDFEKYQRPASNGRGYVAICPGESGNNYYVDDPLIVAYLKSKYENYLKSTKL